MITALGWCALGLAAWLLLGVPAAVVVGRYLRDRTPR